MRYLQDCWDAITDTLQSMSTLATTYLQFLVVALTRARKLDPLSGSEEQSELLGHSATLFADYIDSCSKIFQSRDAFNTIEHSDFDSTETVFAGFLLELQVSDDSTIAYHLLEILSLLAHSSPSTGSRFGRQLLTANWKALHTVYISSTEKTTDNVVPFSLIQAMKSAALGSPSRQKQIDKCLQDTILSRRGSDAGPKFPIRQIMLRHWGVLALFPRVTDMCISHFVAIYEELALLLGSYDELVGVGDPQDEEKKDDRLQSTLDKERVGQERDRTSDSAVCTIPDLHGTSFSVAFETLLHVTVAGMGILSIGLSNKGGVQKGQTESGTKESGPYRSFESLMMLFHSLVDLFMKRGHHFSRRTLSTIFNASKHMLSMTLIQVTECVEWRNSRPLLSMAEKNRGCYDPGAVSYLQAFLDTGWTHMIIPILSFCDFVSVSEEEEEDKHTESGSKRQQSNSNRIDDGDEDYVDNDSSKAGRAPSLTNRNTRNRQRHAAKANSLRYSVEKVAVIIEDIASSHNLTTPDLVVSTATRTAVLPTKRKSRGDKDEGFHQLQGKSKAKQLADLLASGRKSSKLPRLAKDDISSESEEDRDDPLPTGRIQKVADRGTGIGKDLSEDDEEDEGWGSQDEASDDQQDSSEAFGATGNWGEDDDSQASSSSGSLQMETSLF